MPLKVGLIAETKYKFVKLVVIFLHFTRCDYVIPSLILDLQLFDITNLIHSAENDIKGAF